MYAVRKVYVKQHDFQEPSERYTVQVAKGGKPVPGIEPERISVIEEEVMYWRKANHIHKWFVDNVQNGQDDCKEYYVDDDDLRELLSVCNEVIEACTLVAGQVLVSQRWDPKHQSWCEQREPGKVLEDATVAKQLLPTSDGFFFGSTEYDEEYLNDVVQTRDWAGRMLADIGDGVPGNIYYSSSW